MTVADLRQQFLSAFARTWSTAAGTIPDKIVGAYAGSRSWTDFLFAEKSGFFHQVKDSLVELGGTRIEQVRREDDKIDMSYVGGTQCFGERGWGYASRQLVLIEHENQIERADEEFYKLLFRIADLKVLALPDWAAGSRKVRDPLRETIQRFAYLASITAGHGQSNNILVLISERDSQEQIPRWRYLAPPWTDGATPLVLAESALEAKS